MEVAPGLSMQWIGQWLGRLDAIDEPSVIEVLDQDGDDVIDVVVIRLAERVWVVRMSRDRM